MTQSVSKKVKGRHKKQWFSVLIITETEHGNEIRHNIIVSITALFWWSEDNCAQLLSWRFGKKYYNRLYWSDNLTVWQLEITPASQAPHGSHGDRSAEYSRIRELVLLRMLFYLYSIGVRNGTAQYRRWESRITAARVLWL